MADYCRDYAVLRGNRVAKAISDPDARGTANQMLGALLTVVESRAPRTGAVPGTVAGGGRTPDLCAQGVCRGRHPGPRGPSCCQRGRRPVLPRRTAAGCPERVWQTNPGGRLWRCGATFSHPYPSSPSLALSGGAGEGARHATHGHRCCPTLAPTRRWGWGARVLGMGERIWLCGCAGRSSSGGCMPQNAWCSSAARHSIELLEAEFRACGRWFGTSQGPGPLTLLSHWRQRVAGGPSLGRPGHAGQGTAIRWTAAGLAWPTNQVPRHHVLDPWAGRSPPRPPVWSISRTTASLGQLITSRRFDRSSNQHAGGLGHG